TLADKVERDRIDFLWLVVGRPALLKILDPDKIPEGFAGNIVPRAVNRTVIKALAREDRLQFGGDLCVNGYAIRRVGFANVRAVQGRDSLEAGYRLFVVVHAQIEVRIIVAAVARASLDDQHARRLPSPAISASAVPGQQRGYQPIREFPLAA